MHNMAALDPREPNSLDAYRIESLPLTPKEGDAAIARQLAELAAAAVAERNSTAESSNEAKASDITSSDDDEATCEVVVHIRQGLGGIDAKPDAELVKLQPGWQLRHCDSARSLHDRRAWCRTSSSSRLLKVSYTSSPVASRCRT
jgi:hypothetical protein